VSRATSGSVIHDAAVVVQRAVQMVREKSVIAIDGSTVALQTDTICLHGDTPGAAALAKQIRAGLEAAGIRVTRLSG
jgi:UPF0271 protein